MNMIRAGLILNFALANPGMAGEAEEIFDQAKDYTVRIDVTITTPFIEDDLGAHHGAGFIVDKQRRWILTNAHVAGSSPSTIGVVFEDGTRANAQKVYVDPYLDLAIIELQGNFPDLRQAPLACDSKVGVGHAVGAFGHPWGLNFTGTQGVISGRTTSLGPEYLQTDTPINGGNSGGPLISMRSGKIVGINTASMNSDEDQNTNFAVPIGHACRVIALLRDGLDPSPPDLAWSFYQLKDERGPLIVAHPYIADNQVGLLEGDEILAVNGQSVSSRSELVHELRGNLHSVQLSVRRNDDVLGLTGQLAPRPNVIDRPGVKFSGILFAESIYRNMQSFGSGYRVMIHSIELGSHADGEDLELFDFVSHVNGTRIDDLVQLKQVLASARDSDDIRLDLLRIAFDTTTGQFLHAVRRDITWTEPELLGQWNELLGSAMELDE